MSGQEQSGMVDPAKTLTDNQHPNILPDSALANMEDQH
jgi:hypothetical protein